jgi:hypothetical protein
MEQEISVAQVKEKIAAAQVDIIHIINQLQAETQIKVKGLLLYANQMEVARDEDLLVKIEYEL